MRLAVLLLLAVLVLSGCGSDDDPKPAAPAERQAESYLDPDSDLVASLSLDYDGEDWEAIKELYGRVADTGAFRDELGENPPPTLDAAIAGLYGLDFEKDIAPVLGGELLLGMEIEPAVGPDDRAHYVLTFQYELPDVDAFLEVLRKFGAEPAPLEGVEGARTFGDGAGLIDDTLVVVIVDGGDDGADGLLREAIRSTDGPPLPDAEGALAAVRVTPDVLAADLRADQLEAALALEPVGTALRGASARLDASSEGFTAEARVDFEGLAEDELPLGPDTDLELPADEGIASGSADQSRTTVFLARLARAIYPDSKFVREVEAFERDAGVNFEEEVLRAFAGPSVSVMRAVDDGWAFAARSTLSDPERMRELLPELAPVLPDILAGLEGLGEIGLGTLLFVAPDAPLTPGAFAILPAIKVRPAGEDLYEITGLDPPGDEPLPQTLVYGMVGDAFVVGSSRELAQEAATLETQPAEPAATRTQVDIARLIEQVGRPPEGFVQLVEAVDASGSAEDGDLVFRARLDVP